MDLIHTRKHLELAVDQLVALEPRFKVVVETHGLPPLRKLPEGAPTIFRIVTDQLISRTAAQAIWNRIAAGLAPLTAERVAASNETELRRLGLTGAKARAFLAISEADILGHFDRRHLQSLDDNDVRAHLMQIRGIGPWTAEIYMLSVLGRADAWPAGDIALQTATAHLLELSVRPDAREMERLSVLWRPLRSVAARLLWCHCRGMGRIDQGK
ncbi:MAG: DNA-3-methyladenine glycosylase 2 family protein [Alphaproteobacteria bacterium]|nr:DNA-3-methyladenine glycosylase 2 family protein [Alphaproteobacteria bacterium]